MNRKTALWFAAGFILFMTVSTLGAHYASSVLKTDMSDGLQVVIARKFLMEAVKENVVSINQRLTGGNIQEAAVNGETIAAVATVLPPLFKETHQAVYPVKDSNSFFKGAEPAPFEKAAEALRAAAMDVKKAADAKDAGGLKKAFGALGESCGGCHAAYRGKY
ncbi:MAG: cytochrome c [Pseudomonadota bacterium]